MKGLLVPAVAVAVFASWVPRSGFGGEMPPERYRTAPIIPYAKQVGEHRFRSTRTYEDTLDYYRKTFRGSSEVSFEKIINNSRVRALHLRNKVPGGRWEGLNIYEHNGSTFIFAVFSDAELKAIEKEKESKGKSKSSASGTPKNKSR